MRFGIKTKDRFGNLVGSSFDRGFYSPDNKSQLAEILDYVVLPKKGRLSVKDKEIEQSEEFVESRRKHSAVESSITYHPHSGWFDEDPSKGSKTRIHPFLNVT